MGSSGAAPELSGPLLLARGAAPLAAAIGALGLLVTVISGKEGLAFAISLPSGPLFAAAGYVILTSVPVRRHLFASERGFLRTYPRPTRAGAATLIGLGVVWFTASLVAIVQVV